MKSSFRSGLFSYYLSRIVSFLILLNISLSFGQSVSKSLLNHINHELHSIDSLISAEQYDLVLIKIEQIKSYSGYMSDTKNTLFINLKEAEALIGKDRHEEALDIVLEGLSTMDEIEYSELKGMYLKFLGILFWKSRDYERSKFYFENLLSNSEVRNDTIDILSSNLYLGLIASRRGLIDSAIYHYQKNIKFPLNERTSDIISKSYNNLSGKVSSTGELDLAMDYANKSLDIKVQQHDSLGIAYALVNLSDIYYYKEEYDSAKLSYKDALSLLNILKHNDASHKLRAGVLLNIAYSNEMLGEFEQAYKFLERGTDLKDSLAEVGRIQNISEIEAKYNVAEKSAETEREKRKRAQAQALFYGTALAFLAILALGYIFYRNYRLKQQAKLDHIENESQTKIINATIDAKEKERKAIAETLHDSVSALLSSANLHLQATKAQLKQKSPQEITKAQTIVNEASVKIRDLSHELISSVLLKFGLAFAVHDMCQKYSNSELTLHSDDDGIKRYHQDFEIKIHNIIEELINNILKHSKASNATIMLAHKENDMLSVRISDDGVGFNPRKVRGKDGLGLSHIEARIKVMKGVFNIISSKDNGTNIFILVPIQFKESTVSA